MLKVNPKQRYSVEI